MVSDACVSDVMERVSNILIGHLSFSISTDPSNCSVFSPERNTEETYGPTFWNANL